jgi:SAM-dependent methyltransferase
VNSAPPQSSLRRVADWVDLYLDGIHDSLRIAAPHAHGRLLDVGCGVKPYQRIFAPYVSQYVGVEHEATFSLTKDSDAMGSPDFVYDGTDLPFADASFETVLSVSVLEHTPDPQHLFAEMARVLIPGGTMIQLVPFSFRLHEEPHDYYRFTPHSLRHLCGLYGLEVINIGAHGSLWSVLCQKLMTYLVFDVSRMRAVAQSMGKLGFEAPHSQRVRVWTLPFTVPVIMVLAIAARALERTIPTRNEALGFYLVARKAPLP